MSDPERELLAPLARLKHAGEGRIAYYRRLVDDADECVRAGAWAELIKAGGVVEADWPQILQECRHAYVRQLAVDYFELLFDHERSRLAALTPCSEAEDPRRTATTARLEFDAHGAVLSEAEKFLSAGAVVHLVRAAAAADNVQGWRGALVWCVRALLLAPHGADYAGTIYLLLIQSSQASLLEQFRRLLSECGLHQEFDELITGAVLYLLGDYSKALEVLNNFSANRMDASETLRPLTESIQVLRADALDKSGHFRLSYEEYVAANKRSRDTRVTPSNHYLAAEARKALRVPRLSPDPRADVFQMLGFPRSGTTLLENALSSHPEIETFEEIPSHKACAVYIFSQSTRDQTGGTSTAIFEEARRRYYLELDVRRRKPGAHILVDKLPLQSGDALFMQRLFPQRRYVFSIRHPFDVVLSCFRQQFAANVSMENFRTIPDSIKLYDFTMRQWFETFSLESNEVCYIRYEQLVDHFEPTMRKVFAFLGVDWDDKTLGFAEGAEHRGYKTPSYQKVRQGLGIGVQTYWRNYDFLFQTFDAEPLRRWAEFFGYPTK